MFPRHDDNNEVLQNYEDYLNTPWSSNLQRHPRVATTRCVADIAEHHDFLHDGGVRFAIANPIVDMLCWYFDYRVTLEESDYKSGDDALSTSPGSRHDLVSRSQTLSHAQVAYRF